ncbi:MULTISPECIES: TonB-dependent receptor domain-containing protein [unclassified Brevundimonas]|uniref:TonB-dependent receptor domain-containing protein n=1 Tax=unclassified Brevundimonas TaxID=2622653 RepID=UPI0025BCFED1|nr:MULTISPECIES: TonB-dependent receptor [unclassified Brevundimonas]
MRFNRLHLLASTVLAGALAATSVSAQTAQAPAGQDQASDLGEIVVTGSRIRRNDLTAANPISVVSSQTLDNKGYTNVASALNELPVSGVPVSPDGDQAGFGVGRSFVNLFNLGTNRTLVLVNGRRFVGANVASIFSGAGAGGQVDFSSIPTALIDRVETVQATGGAVYGSDAVAGVINVITKKNFEGVEANVEYGVSEEGDADQVRARITAGNTYLDGRLNLAGSYEYAETDSLGYADRRRTALQATRSLNPANTSNSDGIPGSIWYFNRRIPEITEGGLAFRTAGIGLANLLTIADPNDPTRRVAAQFDPNGNLVPYNPGQFVQASIASGGDGLNLGELTSLQSPVTRHNATLFGTYEFTPNVRLDAEVFYNHTEATEDFNQPIYNSGLFGGNSGAIQFSTANPFLSAQARDALLSQPTALPADTANPGERLFWLHRASTDLVEPNSLSESDTYRVVLNLNGDFQAADRNFFWNIAGNFGQNEGFFQQDNIVQSRFLQAINVNRDANGNIQCADADARAAGCVPLNLFGKGARSAEALDYIGTTFRQDYTIKQTTFEANFGGDLVNLPAGPVGFNIGYEYRKEESEFLPNEASRDGVGRTAAIAPLQGEYDTSEYYAELSVPILGGDFSFPFARELTLDGSYRFVDNSIAGEDEAWAVGLRYRPIQDLLLRGSISRSFRAPAITELFTPESTSFMTATDPCDARNINSGPNPQARAANCRAAFQALGLPADFQLTSNIQAATQRGTTAGNPNLVNEIADQETYGFVYQPNYVPGLALSFDWVKIDLTNAIANFGLGSILQVCYDVPNPDPAVCGRFQRGSAGMSNGGSSLEGQILGADIAPNGIGPSTGFINAGYLNFSGWSAGVEYAVNLDDHQAFAGLGGRLSFDFDYFRTETYESSVTGLGFDQVNSANVIGTPETRWKLDTAYTNGGFGLVWTTRYTGETKFSNTSTIENYEQQTISEYFLNDLSLAYRFETPNMMMKDLTARLQIRNVFDVEPPFGTTGVGAYDLIGRYYQIGLSTRF